MNRMTWIARLLPVVAVMLLSQSAMAAQAGPTADTPERPVYLDIMPVADADNAILPEDVVAAMASEALSGARQATIRMKDQALPAGVRVLRIMYIVHQQPDENGMTLAAAASTELLRTANEGDGGVQTFSIYNGMQQTLVQGPNLDRAQTLLRAAFKKELQARISSAFQNAQAL